MLIFIIAFIIGVVLPIGGIFLFLSRYIFGIRVETPKDVLTEITQNQILFEDFNEFNYLTNSHIQW
ncbi:MAG: hypothetical protein ACW98K_14720 [Candidatus Kariarchaeaceae archaeon]|jgi:hypothetical protein